jgi:hypothetical protein
MTGALLIMALVLACREPEPLDTGSAQPRVFVHFLVGCEPGAEQNCAPSLHLCADGAAYAQVSDIINMGSYTETPDEIVASFPAADVPATWVFTVSGGGASLMDDWLGWGWDLEEAIAFPLCP